MESRKYYYCKYTDGKIKQGARFLCVSSYEAKERMYRYLLDFYSNHSHLEFTFKTLIKRENIKIIPTPKGLVKKNKLKIIIEK